MKSTSNIMVHSAGTKWKQIESHVNRTQPYYSNKNVNVHRLGHNMDGHLDDYDTLMKQQFLPYLKAYNHKCVKQRKKSRMYGIPRKYGKGYRKYHDPVSDYLRHTKRRNERLVIFYLGNEHIRRHYYKVLRGKYGLTTAKIRDIENRSLVHTTRIWNNLNPYLKVTDFATNTDESTAHIHTRMAVTGLYGKPRDMAVKSEKKKGIHHFVRKPLMSFNKALVKTYPHAVNSHGRIDSREAMKAMRRRFDPVILKSFNRELAKNGIHLSLGLTRTGEKNHFTLGAYQANKDMKHAYNKIAKKIQSAIPHMTHGGKPATYQNYYNLATGKEHFRFSNGSNVSGADVLGAVNSQSLSNQKQSIKANYRSSAVSEAQPLVHRQISKNTSDAQNSASQSLLATVSSLNSSIATSQADWTASMNNQLSTSASQSASAKVKASVQASMASSVAELQSSFASISTKSNALLNSEANLMSEYRPLYVHHRPITNRQYRHYVKSGVRIDGSYQTGYQLICNGIARTSANASNYSKEANTARTDYKNWNDKASKAHKSYNSWHAKIRRAKQDFENIKQSAKDYIKRFWKDTKNRAIKAFENVFRTNKKEYYQTLQRASPKAVAKASFNTVKPKPQPFDMTKSKYWDDFTDYYDFAHVGGGYPNPKDKKVLGDLQYYVAYHKDFVPNNDPQGHAKTDKRVDKAVGADPKDPSNYESTEIGLIANGAKVKPPERPNKSRQNQRDDGLDGP